MSTRLLPFYKGLLVATAAALFQVTAHAQNSSTASQAASIPTPDEAMARQLRSIDAIFRGPDVARALQAGSAANLISKRASHEKLLAVRRDWYVQSLDCKRLSPTTEQTDCLLKVRDATTQWAKEHGSPERDLVEAIGNIPFSEQLVSDYRRSLEAAPNQGYAKLALSTFNTLTVKLHTYRSISAELGLLSDDVAKLSPSDRAEVEPFSRNLPMIAAFTNAVVSLSVSAKGCLMAATNEAQLRKCAETYNAKLQERVQEAAPAKQALVSKAVAGQSPLWRRLSRYVLDPELQFVSTTY